jgi:hypothetical protein
VAIDTYFPNTISSSLPEIETIPTSLTFGQETIQLSFHAAQIAALQ